MTSPVASPSSSVPVPWSLVTGKPAVVRAGAGAAVVLACDYADGHSDDGDRYGGESEDQVTGT